MLWLVIGGYCMSILDIRTWFSVSDWKETEQNSVTPLLIDPGHRMTQFFHMDEIICSETWVTYLNIEWPAYGRLFEFFDNNITASFLKKEVNAAQSDINGAVFWTAESQTSGIERSHFHDSRKSTAALGVTLLIGRFDRMFVLLQMRASRRIWKKGSLRRCGRKSSLIGV